jgi:GTP-binding protein
MTLTVAIVGRPNVGKSTLFNRLVGRRLALVDDKPGVTRDRREGEASLGDLEFRVIDTAGLDDADTESLGGRMRRQTEMAITGADVCLFMIDARAGITPLDRHFASLVRRSGAAVILVANKCEGKAGEPGLYDAFSLGLGEPVALSAEHGEGTSDLYAALKAFSEANGAEAGARPGRERKTVPVADTLLEPGEDGDEEADLGPDRPMRVAIVGRPNAGKSTLINKLLGEERLLTGPEAGITRDSISVDWQWRGQPIKLFDTAGLRRQARVVEKLEKLSVSDALRAIRFAEVVILTIDATQPFEKQDLQIADLVAREGRALVIAVNKWDLVEDAQKTKRFLEEECERLLPQVRGVALITVSALAGKGLDRLIAATLEAYAAWNRRVPTAALNRWLAEALERHSPPAARGRRIKLRYMTQAKARPPTFIVFCSRPEELPEAYTRYLINGLREAFDLPAVPIRLQLRKGRNPYAEK